MKSWRVFALVVSCGISIDVDAVAQTPAATAEPNLKADYDAEQAAVSAPQPKPLDPTSAIKPLQKAKEARAAHLAGKLPEALQLAQESVAYSGSPSFVNADNRYTLGRILEALRKRSAAAEQYQSGLNSAASQPVAQRLLREGLSRVAPPPALARAAELEKKGELAGVVLAYEEALRPWPNDAPILSELSWAAVRAGEGRKAREAAERAIAQSESQPIKAAAYYNLGRAFELLKDRDAAIGAYHASVALRDWLDPEGRYSGSTENRQLRATSEALRKLGAPMFPSTAKALAGPYKDLAEAEIEASACRLETKRNELAAPFASVQGCEHNEDYALKIATPSGLFLLDKFLIRENRGEYDLTSARLQGSRLIVLSSLTTGRFATTTSSYVTICSAAAGKPACIGPIEISRVYTGYTGGKEDGHSLKPETLFAYKWRLLPDDTLSITSVRVRNDLDLTGKFKLRFP